MAILGFLLVDKPKHTNSFSVVRVLRKTLGIRRIGYAGILDPLATGLMIVAVGEATKLLHNLEGLDKVYDVTVRFGSVSDTYDSEGPFHLYPRARKPTRAQVEKILEDNFFGERMQIPPSFSAVKISGQHAYHLARKGLKVELKPRKVTFYDIRVKRFAYPLLHCSVHCSSGTYIRSFANDLGRLLKCGGYVQELRRTKIGSVTVKDAILLDDITPVSYRKFIAQPQEFLQNWQQCHVTDSEYRLLANGGFIKNRGGFRRAPILAIHGQHCVGLLELVHGNQLKFAKKFNIV